MKKIGMIGLVLLACMSCKDERLEKDRAAREQYLEMQRQEEEKQAAEARAAEEKRIAEANANAVTTLEAGAVTEVHVRATGATMTFDVTRITVPTRSRVRVVFTNTKPGVLSHNWVLVKPGTEALVAAEGLNAGEKNGYFVDGSNVLAHTDLVPPGSTTQVEFNAPEKPGSYPYICTFPGHYMMMKGTLDVTP